MRNAKQFDVYVNPDSGSVKSYPYLVILQYFDSIDTRIISPIVLLEKVKSLSSYYINPVVTINDQKYVILTSMMTNIRISSLKNKIADITTEQFIIKLAIDKLFFF